MERKEKKYAGTRTIVRSPSSHIGYGEDKETQLRITLRWRLMGGNKKGHRVATVAGEKGKNSPPPVTPCVKGERYHPTSCRTYCFSSQNSQAARCASSALGDLRVVSGPRRVGDQNSAVTSAGTLMDVTLV